MQNLVAKFENLSRKHVAMSLSAHHILSKSECPRNRSKMLEMEHVTYVNDIDSYINVMISTS